MVSQQVIQRFNSVGVKPQEQYSFISFCKQFFESQHYKFNRVICHSSDSGVRYTYVIEPTKQEHRYSYIHFFFHYLDKRYHRITYEKLGSPDAIEQNFCVISQIIFSKVKNLVEVPPMHIESVKCLLEDQTVQYLYKVKLNDITKSFPSKTSCIKYMTNELKSVIRSPWSQKENMALIRNLIDRCAKYTCFQTYISRFIFLRIYYFLGSFTFSKLTSDEIFAIFKDFYKVDTQYLLYKPIEDPIPTYFISPSKISGNPETTDKNTLDALYDEFVNSQQDSFEFININHEQTNVPSVFRTT